MENNQELEKYGSLNAWALELGLGKGLLERRLQLTEGIIARDQMGRIQRNCRYYSETVVRQKCADLFVDIHDESDTGLCTVSTPDGGSVLYGTRDAWAEKLGLSWNAVNDRLKNDQGIRGKSSNFALFFPEHLVQAVCADLLTAKVVDSSGYYTEISSDGQKTLYGSVIGLSRLIGVKEPTLNRRLKKAQGMEVRDHLGRKYMFFSEKVAREISADLFEDLPHADDSGYLVIGPERYTTTYKFSRQHGISEPEVRSRFRNISGVRGKDKPGRVRTFFAESLLLEICKDLISKKQHGT